MYRRAILGVLVLALGISSLANGATIVWVSDNKTPANNVPADQGWVDLLVAQGYTVNLDFRAQQARTLDAAEVDVLNAADLIIISRDTDSGNYASNAAEVTQWNSITTPIMMQVAHIAQNTRWKWVNIASTNNATPTMQAVIPTHPVFKGVSLDANNQVTVLTANSSFVSTTDAGNGTVVAKRADNNQPWIVEWAPGTEFYAGAVEKAGGKRMLLLSGGTSPVSDGAYNLTDEGQKIFLNAIKYLLGIKPGASDPEPENAAVDVPRDPVLSWTPALATQKHDVYLGSSKDDVDAATVAKPLGVLAGANLDANTFEPADLLQYGQTYYWRVDEVNTTPDATVFKGEVWSFTAEPYAYPIKNVTATASSATIGMGPENTVNGSGLNANDQHSTDGKQMWLSTGSPSWIQFEFDKVYKLDELWVWNSNQQMESFVGFGAKDVTIEYSADANTWTPLAGVPEFAQATGLPDYVHDTVVDFGGVEAKYVKLTINDNWGDLPQAGLSEVRFFYVPLQAREPDPAADATGQALDLTLNWRPGREAVSHTVYFGTDANAVADGTVAARSVTDHRFSPGVLNLATTYYWRADEVNDAATPSVQQGDVWSFTTEAYSVVDDFESYTNDSPRRIFQTWRDGFGFSADEFFPNGYNGNGTGAAVGHDIWTGGYTFLVETANVHGGKQAMPVYYDNTTTPFISEAVRTFGTSQNWTASGIKSLSLYFRGEADNTGQLYVKINSTKVAYNGSADDIAKLGWVPWNIDLSGVSNLSKVTTLTIGIEGSGSQGVLYVDDIGLYPKTPEYYVPSDPGKANLLALYACEGNANDTSGHNLNGTVKQATFVASERPGGGSAVKVDKAGYLDLGNPALLDFSTGDWALTAWYKTAMVGTGDANKGTVVGKGGDNTGGKRYGLIMSETVEGVLTLVTDDDVTKYVVDSQSVTNDDQWHFVVGQRVGTTLEIYIDGQLENSVTITTPPYDLSGTSQHDAYIGAMTYHPDGSLYKLFSGLIDEVHIYNRALSMEEILWLMGSTTPVAKPF
jgi:hypothetical protein